MGFTGFGEISETGRHIRSCRGIIHWATQPKSKSGGQGSELKIGRSFFVGSSKTTCRRMVSWSTKAHSSNSKDPLAWKLGFSSTEINALRKEDIDSTDTDHMLRDFCVDGFYHIDEGKLRSMTHRLKEYWRNLKRMKDTARGVSRFDTDDARTMTRRKYNCPPEDEHHQDHSYPFVENVYSAD